MKTRIRSGKQKAVIELFEDRAPRAAKKIGRLLPIEVPLCHAKFAGDEIMFMIPAVIDPEFYKSTIEPGDVLYYPIQQTICLFFSDHIVEFAQGPFNVIGHIIEGKADLTQLAERIICEGFQWGQFSKL
ncbi:MAG: cyclophilin-like fold protein [Desulfobacterales bacterium]|nr:cyclophilin-like fold protein [Desulfobacterales bacterium]